MNLVQVWQTIDTTNIFLRIPNSASLQTVYKLLRKGSAYANPAIFFLSFLIVQRNCLPEVITSRRASPDVLYGKIPYLGVV